MIDRFEVVWKPLQPWLLADSIRTDACGAVALFVGTVRSPNLGQEVRYLEYEGYEAMILPEMRRVAEDIRIEHDATAFAIAHRLGRVGVGEASIVVAVASAHRRAALDACARGIDLCKERLPVWKREATTHGETWTEGTTGRNPTL